MRQAGYRDSSTFRRYYQPSNDGVDGQAVFLGRGRRDVASDAFRELSIPYNPNLSQRLPARERHNLEESETYLYLEEELARLTGKKDAESMELLEGLRRQKRNLIDDTLKS